MNLHQIVAPYVGSVNPLAYVDVRVSVGYTTNTDGSRVPSYATPGGITASIAGTLLTVTAVASGVLQVGQTLADLTSDLLPQTVITALGTGAGGIGTYTVNQAQTVASEPMTTTRRLLGQIQPMTWRDLAQVEGLNLQGVRKAIYLTGLVDGIVRETNQGGDLISFPDGTIWLVAQVLEGFNLTAHWTKLAATQQNGS